MIQYDGIVFIGRFQPLHEGHLKTIEAALKLSHKLVLIIGSDKTAPSIRQPWSTKQRISLIKKCLTPAQLKRVVFIPIRDRLYSDTVWNQNIQQEVNQYLRGVFPNKINFKIGIMGHAKDSTSYYLKIFPAWTFIETGNYKNINSTNFREIYFCAEKTSYQFIPKKIKNWLQKFRNTAQFLKIKKEYVYVKSQFAKGINPVKAEVNFLILWGNYILLIKRKSCLGGNLYAFPGCGIQDNENIMEKGFENLVESTKINLNLKQLKEYFVQKSVFNYPQRNPFGLCPTNLFYFEIPIEIFPTIFAGKNVVSAKWILLDDLSAFESKFYADHYQILQILLKRIKGC